MFQYTQEQLEKGEILRKVLPPTFFFFYYIASSLEQRVATTDSSEVAGLPVAFHYILPSQDNTWPPIRMVYLVPVICQRLTGPGILETLSPKEGVPQTVSTWITPGTH